jgi:ornithine decarboxylase
MTARITKFYQENKPATPCVIIDLEKISDNYGKLRYYFDFADIFYAVKASPGKPILESLQKLGSNFDCASIPEIKSCFDVGATPEQISFGNTIKKERDIEEAFKLGISLYAFDSEPELEKIARAAPGSKVFCRILWEGGQAEWALSKKFGCERDMAVDLLTKARDFGLEPYGVSLHLGSQQKDVEQWYLAIGAISEIFKSLTRENIELKMINLGGGFPCVYRDSVPNLQSYFDQIEDSMETHFSPEKSEWPRIILEPGRSLVGDAGIMFTEVILISKKSYQPYEPHWVYLDAGKFRGLIETLDESIKYRIVTDYEDDADTFQAVLAGPSCDSMDTLYQKSDYRLPKSLKIGDVIRIMGAGAYTLSYAAGYHDESGIYGGFNGQPAPRGYYVGGS